MCLIDICRIFHPRTTGYTFFASACGIVSRMNDMLGHKTDLNKLKIEIISSIFSDNNDIKLEIN